MALARKALRRSGGTFPDVAFRAALPNKGETPDDRRPNMDPPTVAEVGTTLAGDGLLISKVLYNFVTFL